jgi:hypothetical protein
MPETISLSPSEQDLHSWLSDLVALSALPGLLANDEPSALAGHLAEILLSSLNLNLAYACVRDELGGAWEATRTHGLRKEQHLNATHLLNLLDRRLDCLDSSVHHAATGLHLHLRPIGLHAEWASFARRATGLSSPRHWTS